MNVGSVDFKVNLDLSEIDKQLKDVSKKIESALNNLNLKVGVGAGKSYGKNSASGKDDCCDEIKEINSNIIAYGKQHSKLLNDIKQILSGRSKKAGKQPNPQRPSGGGGGRGGASLEASIQRSSIAITASIHRSSVTIAAAIHRSSSSTQRRILSSSAGIRSSISFGASMVTSEVRRTNSLLGTTNSLLESLGNNLPDAIGKSVKRYSRDGLLMAMLKAPFKMMGGAVGGATRDVSRGFFENIGQSVSTGFGTGKAAKKASARIKHFMDLADEYLIGGVDNFMAAFLAELSRSKDFSKAMDVAVPNTRVMKEHLPKFKRIMDLSGILDSIKRGEDIPDDIKKLLVKQKTKRVITKGPKKGQVVEDFIWSSMGNLEETIATLKKDPSNKFSNAKMALALFDTEQGLVEKTKPKVFIDNFINPLLKEISHLTVFIGKIQQHKAILGAKDKIPEVEALLPKLEEGQKGYLQVIGGAVQRQGIGGAYTLETLFEPLAKNRKILPVHNPDTDPAGNESRDPSLASALKFMKEAVPDIFGNQELYNTLLNGIVMAVQSVNPSFQSEAVTNALANIMVALKNGVDPEDISTISYSLGGKEARALADALNILGINVKTLALAYPEINASQTDVPNFRATLITPDALGSIKNVLGIGGDQNMAFYTPEGVPPSPDAHAPKHYFKDEKQIKAFFEFLNLEIPEVTKLDGISNYFSMAENFSEKLTNIAQAQALAETGKLDPKKVAQGIGIPPLYQLASGDVVNDFLESTYKGQLFKNVASGEASEGYSPEMIAIAKKMVEAQDIAYGKLEEKLISFGLAEPKGKTTADRAAELFGQLKLRGTVNADLIPMINAIDSGTSNDRWFTGDLDPEKMLKRSADAINAANWFKGQGKFPDENYVNALVDSFQTMKELAVAFHASRGRKTPELNAVLDKAKQMISTPIFQDAIKSFYADQEAEKDAEKADEPIDYKGQYKLFHVVNHDLIPFLESLQSGTIINDSYFAADLNLEEMLRRAKDAEKAVAHFAGKGKEDYVNQDYVNALVEIFQTIKDIGDQFRQDAGQTTAALLAKIEKARQIPFVEDAMYGFPEKPRKKKETLSTFLGQGLLPEEIIPRNAQKDFTVPVPDWLKGTPSAAIAYNQMLADVGHEGYVPPLTELESVAYGMSGTSAFIGKDYVYKNAPKDTKLVASKQEIEAYKKLAGRYSPLMYAAEEGKAMVVEKVRGKSTKAILDELAKPAQKSQEKLAKLREELEKATDNGEKQDIIAKIEKESREFGIYKKAFNEVAVIIYENIGRLGKTLAEMGVVHNDLSPSNVFRLDDGSYTSIDLGNAIPNPTDFDVFKDQLTAIQRATVDSEYSEIADIGPIIYAILKGYAEKSFPKQGKRIGSVDNLPKYSDVSPVPLGSEHKGILEEYLGYKELAEQIRKQVQEDLAKAEKAMEEARKEAAKKLAEEESAREAIKAVEPPKVEVPEIPEIIEKLNINEDAFRDILKLLTAENSNLALIARNLKFYDSSDLVDAISKNLNIIKGIERLDTENLPATIKDGSRKKNPKNVLAGHQGHATARINQIKEELLQRGVEIPDEILQQLTKASNEVGNAIVEGVAKGISEAELNETALSIVRPIINIVERELDIKSPSGWAEGVGQNIVEGLANGIVQSELDAIASNIAQPIIEGVEDEFEIKSPSEWAQKVGDYIAQGLDQGLRAVDVVTSRFLESLGNDLNPTIFEGFEEMTSDAYIAARDNIVGIVSNSALLAGAIGLFATFQETLMSVGQEALTVAIEFEKITTATQFILGSSSKAIAKIEELRESARNLGIDQMAVVESYNSLAAATRNTPLEGRNTDLLAESLNQAAAAFSLTAEQVEGAFTAIQQIAGKGVVSAEELRGQLAERIPGAFQIAARAMKVSEQELYQMMSAGALSATDFLPALARQLKIETFSGVDAATQTAGFQLQKIQNYLQDIQITIGNILLPAAKVALKTINFGLKLLSDNLQLIFDRIGVGLTFATVHFVRALGPLIQLIAPIVQGAIAKALKFIFERLTAAAIATTALGKSLFLVSAALSAVNNSGFLKTFVIIEAIKSAYQSMRTILGAFDLSDNPLFAEQTVWDDLAKRVKKTTASIKKDIKGLEKSVGSFALSREIDTKGIEESVPYYLTNTNPLINSQARAKRREEAAKAVNEGKVPNNILGFNFQPYDREGRITGFASMREDDYVMDLEKRMREIDKELNLDKVIKDLTLAKQGKGELMQIKSIDDQIAAITAQKGLLDASDVATKNSLSEMIAKLQDEREKMAVPYVAARTGMTDTLKTIDAELERVTDPQAIAQLEATRSALQKYYDLMDKHEAINGPISMTKKFTLALQELKFAFDAIAENAERTTTAMERTFAKERLAEFSTDYFLDIQVAFKESKARLKIIEKEAADTQSAIKRIGANLENNPSYREVLATIKKEEESLGREMTPADLEYFKERVSSSENQDLITAIDSEIQLRTQTIELEKKLLEKDQAALEVRQAREEIALAGIDQLQQNADTRQQLAESQNRKTLAMMELKGESGVSALEALFNEEMVKQNLENARTIKQALQTAFKGGHLSAREYQDRIRDVNIELANLNAELAEAKVQSKQALDARFLEAIEKQLAAASHVMDLNQINRESHSMVAYGKDLEYLNSSQVELAKVTRDSENQIANLTEQIDVAKRTLDTLTASGSNSDEIEAKITETTRQIETQSAELVQAQIQANQSIIDAQNQVVMDDIERAQGNLEHRNSVFELNQEYELLTMQLATVESLDPMANFNYEAIAAYTEVDNLNAQLQLSLNLLQQLSESGINTPETRDRIKEIEKEIETQKVQLKIAERQAELDVANARHEAILNQVDKEQGNLEHLASITELNKEYELLGMQLTIINSEDTMAKFNYETAIANSEVENLNAQLLMNIQLLQKLSDTGINTAEVRDRIKEVEKEIETQQVQLKIAERKRKLDIENARLELENAKAAKFIQDIDLDKEAKEHQRTLINLNLEYQRLLRQRRSLVEGNPLNSFTEAITESNVKIKEMVQQLSDAQAILTKLEESPIQSEEIKGRIAQIKKEIEVQTSQLAVQKEQSKIDLINALGPQLTAMEQMTREIENQNKSLDRQLDLLNATKENYEAMASTLDAEMSQLITATSEIASQFENIGIASKDLFESQLDLNRKKMNADLRNLKKQLQYEEQILDINREKFLLDRKASDAEMSDRLSTAEQDLASAYNTRDKDLIKLAEEKLRIAQEDYNLLKKQQRIEDLIYSKQKETLAIKSNAQIKAQETTKSALVYEDALKRVDFIIKGINKKLEGQKIYLESYQKLFTARSDFLQSQGDFKLQKLNVGADIIKQLANQDISATLKEELQKQASVLGVNGQSESDLLLKTLEMENTLAKERLETLKQQQKIDQALLNLDLKKAELDARQAVVQAQILTAWSEMMGVGNTSGLIEEAIANLDFAREQGDMARQSQAISQAAEINKLLTEDWFRQLQQRREIAGTENFDGNLGQTPKAPKLIKPNLRIPELESDRYKPMEFPEEQVIPEFNKMSNGIGETNKLLEEIKTIMQKQNESRNNVELTVVSSNAVADAGKILNDITKPF